MSTFAERRLRNGLTVMVESMDGVSSVAAGFLVRTGARDETADLAGVSHFLEHMCFKGTAKRGWQQITVDFDALGSVYNAFTSKEKTFYFGWVRDRDAEPQTELLADMMRSILPPAEFDTEKKVILEEIAMSGDQIDRHLYDLVHEKIFAGHPLAWPVLGTNDTVARLQRDQMHAYFASRYNPANMALLVCGSIRADDAFAIAERLCGDWPAGPPRAARQPPRPLPTGVAVARLERFKQQALALIFPAASAVDPMDETAESLAAVLGGQNSRFFWKIVQAGVAPVAAALRVDYCDNGLMLLYGCCEPPHCEQLRDAFLEQLRTIQSGGVTDVELARVKNRRRTGLATEAEAPYHRLMQLAHDVDMFGRPRSVDERLAAVDAVTPARIGEYLERYPMTDGHYLVSVGPREWPKV
ncbi:MAG: pitrilysin family protein [Phycisphaerae bacterium]